MLIRLHPTIFSFCTQNTQQMNVSYICIHLPPRLLLCRHLKTAPGSTPIAPAHAVRRQTHTPHRTAPTKNRHGTAPTPRPRRIARVGPPVGLRSCVPRETSPLGDVHGLSCLLPFCTPEASSLSPSLSLVSLLGRERHATAVVFAIFRRVGTTTTTTTTATKQHGGGEGGAQQQRGGWGSRQDKGCQKTKETEETEREQRQDKKIRNEN